MTKHPIPHDALDDRLAFVGLPGSGKTYNAMAQVERLLQARSRVIHIDPLGVAWGLRLLADGKTASPFNVVIFGGTHGDLPLTENSGALIGETAARMAESCLIDLSALKTAAAERRFMLAFLSALYRRSDRSPVHLIFDEADLFAPQQILDREGEAHKLLGMMQTIIRRGRVFGFIPYLITQRPAVISKNVLAMMEGLVAFQLTSSQDREAIGDWVKGQADKETWKELWAELPTMQPGQGLVWIPRRKVLARGVQFPAKLTFDSSRAPKRGERHHETMLAPINIEALRAKLSTVEAEAEANDPKALKAKIAALTDQIATLSRRALDAGTSPAVQQALRDARQKGFETGHAAGLGTLAPLADQITAGISRASDAAIGVTGELGALTAVVRDFNKALTRQTEQKVPPDDAPSHRTIPQSVPLARQPVDGPTSPSVRAVLEQIHRASPVALSFEAAAARAGISRRSSAYRRYRQEVEASAEVERRADGRLRSGPGYAAALPAGRDPVETWAARLPPSYAQMLRVIAAARIGMTKEEVAAAAGVSPTSSGLSAGLRELETLSLIARDGEHYGLHPDLAS